MCMSGHSYHHTLQNSTICVAVTGVQDVIIVSGCGCTSLQLYNRHASLYITLLKLNYDQTFVSIVNQQLKNAQVSEKPGEEDEAGEREGDMGDAADSEVEEEEHEGGEEQPQAKTRKLRFPTEQSPIEVQGEISDERKAEPRDSLLDKSLTPVRRRK